MIYLILLAVVTLVGAGVGFATFPLIANGIAPSTSGISSLGRLQVIVAQLAFGAGVVVKTQSGDYAWHAADVEGDELVFDHEGETLSVGPVHRMDKIGFRPFAIVSKPLDHRLSQYVVGDLASPAEDDEVNDGLVTTDMVDDDESDRVPLAEERGGQQLWVPDDHVSDLATDGGQSGWTVALNKIVGDTGELGNSMVLEQVERIAIKDAGNVALSSLMKGLLGVACLVLGVGTTVFLAMTGLL